jgi:hypothetical protein
MPVVKWLLFLSAVAFSPALASAQNLVPGLRDIGGPRALAEGDAYRAGDQGNETLWLNPGALSATPRYEFDVYTLYDPVYGHREIQVSLADNQTNAGSGFPLAAGLAYTNFASGSGPTRFGGSIADLVLSYALLPGLLYIGATGKYLNLNEAVHANAITMDAGALIKLGQTISGAVVVYNMINVHDVQSPLMLGLAINYGGDGPWHVEVDLRADFASVPGAVKFTYMFGGEYLISNLVSIRVGYTRDEVASIHNPATGTNDPSEYFTTGLAVNIAQFLAIDLAYRNEVGGVEAKEGQVGVRVMF